MFVYWKRPVSVTSGDVERLGDRGRQIDVELAEEVPHDLAGRRCVRDEEVDVAEGGVVVVMVDVHGERNLTDQRGGGAHPLDVRAVERDEHALVGVGRELSLDAVEREERVLLRRVGVTAEVHDDVLAEPLERVREADDRAERVAVGVLVGHEQETLVPT